MGPGEIALFALDATRAFGEAVAASLGVPLASHEERQFEDGEHKARPLEGVRARDTYVIQSLYSDAHTSVNDKLVRLLFFIACLKDHGATSVTAVVPYFAYARKDRRTQPHDPVTIRYAAQLFEAVGTDRVVALDVHNPAAFDNALRIPAVHLETARPFAEHFAARLADEPLTVASPDVGGVKRAERFQRSLASVLGREPALAFLEKTRGGGELKLGRLVGEVKGTTVILLDDLIVTGRTLAHAARACLAAGARQVLAAATHGVFATAANEALAEQALARIVIMDTVDPYRIVSPLVRAKLDILSAAPFVAEAIRRLHAGEAVAEPVAD